MVGFVAFKAGAIDDYVKFGPTDVSASPPDSLKKDSTQVDPATFSSSKYMVLADEETLQKNEKDSVELLKLDEIIIPSSKSGEVFDPEMFMGSSKSLRVFEPRDTLLLNSELDTTTKDSLKATKSGKHYNSNQNNNSNQNQKKP